MSFKHFSPLRLLSVCVTLSLVRCQDGPLFLTPLIDAGLISVARNFAFVTDFHPEIQSYSGFITVNKEYNSNTFFWFFPAAINSSEAPLMLFTEGGPGLTGLHSMFNIVGPFEIENEETIKLRVNSWHKTHNIIFMDNPVGIGFSFTDSDAGLINSSVEAAPNTYEFLIQFLKLFPEYQRSNFYNVGVSFGANYASALGAYIHRKNSQNPEIHINLKGLFLESPFLDPPNQIVFGDFLYGVGLIDGNMRDYYNLERQRLLTLISQEKYEEAYGVYSNIVRLASQDTGYSAMFNILTDEYPNFDHTLFVNQSSFRSAIHVGNLSFVWRNSEAVMPLNFNAMNSVRPYFEEILNADPDLGYRTLIVTGNLDIVTNHLGVQNMVGKFNWTGLPEFTNSTRQIWRSGGSISGYSKSAQGFTHVMMRNAGHTCGYDQSDWTFELVNRFTRNQPIK